MVGHAIGKRKQDLGGFVALVVAAATLAAITAWRNWPSAMPDNWHALNQARSAFLEARPRPPINGQFRQRPLAVTRAPLLNLVIPRATLRLALSRAIPRWSPPPVAVIMHDLRLWGPHFRFHPAHKGAMDGAWLLSTLLDSQLVEARALTSPNGFLQSTPYGIRVMTIGDIAYGSEWSAGHADQLLKTLAEAGIPSSSDVRTQEGHASKVYDILADSCMRFEIAQELEFTAIAYSLWLPPSRSWTNRFGVTTTFDILMEQMTRFPPGSGTCNGCHLPYAIVTLLRADMDVPVLSEQSRLMGHRWLRDCSSLLDRSKLHSGGWNWTWSGTATAPSVYGTSLDLIVDRIAVTGHHLEWLALAPASARPPTPTIEMAVSALASDLASVPNDQSQLGFKLALPLSHAARAVSLLAGVDPAEAWSEFGHADSIQMSEKP